LSGWGRIFRRSFPGESGFSPRNIWHMRAFFLAWTDKVAILQQAVGERAYGKLKQPASELPESILAQLVREVDGVNLPQAVAAIPWFHNVVLMQKVKDPIERLWYARQTTQHGWSRAVLVHQIETDLYRRQGRALTNFDRTLPTPDSDLAQQAFKDPYCVGFLPMMAAARERELEHGMVTRLRDFLMELGVGFAFVGQQVHMEVGGRDFYIDLLFYHLRLRCFVVVELKNEEFEPEFVGKTNFYLAAVDDRMRHPDDRPSIGLILCKEHNRVIVEYALRDTTRPMGVARWELRKALPEELKGQLPSPDELRAGFGEAENPH
jgi:predicted nuclease of restriction endonuclease-like (RecB) superfamily